MDQDIGVTSHFEPLGCFKFSFLFLEPANLSQNQTNHPAAQMPFSCTTTPSMKQGLYVEAKGARGALKKYAGSDPAALSKDKSLFKVLGQPGGFAKYLHLVFARSVGAQKVVDALTSVKGVGQDVLDRCVWWTDRGKRGKGRSG